MSIETARPWNDDMTAAPRDGEWIEGVNKAGTMETIQFRQIAPRAPNKMWFVGEQKSDGNWLVNTCFYPIKWRPLSEGQSQ
jgi:hypothetical protein